MLLMLISLTALVAAAGFFAWIAVARYKFYSSGRQTYSTQQYLATVAALLCLFVAVVMYGWHRSSS